MAVLDAANRKDLWEATMRRWSDRREVLGAVGKADLQAAINAIDDWCEANQAGFNAAIPLPARAALTAAQKATLLAYIALRRAGEG
jgi:hypothetical protein